MKSHLVISTLKNCERKGAVSKLDIPVVSGEITPEFLNAKWENFRDEIYSVQGMLEKSRICFKLCCRCGKQHLILCQR